MSWYFASGIFTLASAHRWGFAPTLRAIAHHFGP
jgi:hypothetical protein